MLTETRTPKSSAIHTYPSLVCKINLEKPTKKKDYYMTSRAEQIPQSNEC